MADPTVAVDETAELAPVSLYAEQKVEVETLLLLGATAPMAATCLRLATVYGVAARMRFDLTVNEFTRDLWDDRDLEVFGEQFWRPVRARPRRRPRDGDGARRRPGRHGRGGLQRRRLDENYRKLDLVEIITGQLGRGKVSYVHRDEDPRDYRVAFGKVHEQLGFEPSMRVPDGVRRGGGRARRRRLRGSLGGRLPQHPLSVVRTLAKAVLGALLSWLARFSPRKVGVALLYHAVADDRRSRRDVLVPSMPPALFASQLALLTHHYKLVPASALLAAIEARRIGGRIPLAITFDDDDHTHPTTAARLLRDADAPATFFVNAESPDEPRPLWWQQLQRAWDKHKIDTELLAMLGLPPARSGTASG